ncbi:MAG: hypothetical protein WBF89_13080 [Steroidobacteraceae bacterium]
MRLISFKNTVLFKRGIWLTAAALLAFVATPSALDGGLRQGGASSLFVGAVLCACFAYFFWKTQFHRLADEVVDCDDRLTVRRGRFEETILLSDVAGADASSGCGILRITLRLRKATKLGAKIEFLPPASLWSNMVGVKRLASDLTDRAVASNPMPAAAIKAPQ